MVLFLACGGRKKKKKEKRDCEHSSLLGLNLQDGMTYINPSSVCTGGRDGDGVFGDWMAARVKRRREEAFRTNHNVQQPHDGASVALFWPYRVPIVQLQGSKRRLLRSAPAVGNEQLTPIIFSES